MRPVVLDATEVTPLQRDNGSPLPLRRESAMSANTGFYIQGGYIHGPRASGRYFVIGGSVYGPGQSGRYRIADGFICGPGQHGQFYVQDNQIYGPTPMLPWLADYDFYGDEDEDHK